MIKEVTPKALAGRASTEPAPLLLDVREAWELEIARLPDAVHIPMGQIPDRLAELPHDRDIVVVCHSGGRSARVGQFLQQQGYPRVWNLAGGILAWAEQVDPSLPTY
jgi:rhodanese-related sulfurtransferase